MNTAQTGKEKLHTRLSLTYRNGYHVRNIREGKRERSV